jgi:hypothetical protein
VYTERKFDYLLDLDGKVIDQKTGSFMSSLLHEGRYRKSRRQGCDLREGIHCRRFFSAIQMKLAVATSKKVLGEQDMITRYKGIGETS